MTGERRYPVRLNDGRIVGNVVGYTFKTTRSGSRHFLREPVLAWAFDLTLLLRLDREGIETVEVKDTETNIRYRAPLAKILRYGAEVPDYGHGAQWAYHVSSWERSYRGPVARQLTLDIGEA